MSHLTPVPSTAADQANAWLTEADPQVDARLTTTPEGHVCVLLCPHPFGDDINARFTGRGDTRLTATQDARSQLRAFAMRAFSNPDDARANVLTAREAHLYRPGVKGVGRVGRAVRARGQHMPEHSEIQLAALRLRIDRGHDEHTIGDLVGEILAGRARAKVSAPHPEQAALPV